MRKTHSNSGQSIAEYFIIIVVILAAVLSVRFLDKIRGSFNTYFTISQARIVAGI